MKNSFVLILILGLLALGIKGLHPQEIGITDILGKNMAAVGGKEKIEAIKNVSFDIPGRYYKELKTQYLATGSGNLIIVEYIDDLATAMTVLKNEKVTVKRFHSGDEMTVMDKVRIKCFSKLLSGGFSLKYFKGKLKYAGVKKLGLKSYHVLKTILDDHKIEFYVNTETQLLNRLVIKGDDKEKGRQESSYDFSNMKLVDGLNIPSSWYITSVGAGPASNRTETMANFKINQKLDKNMYIDLKLNLGVFEVKKKFLKGNLIGLLKHPRGYFIYVTNWSDDILAQSEFKSKEPILLQFPTQKLDGLYLENPADIDNKLISEGTIILLKQQDRFPAIVFFNDKQKTLHDTFKKLDGITITKGKNKKTEKEGKGK
jgi:hypothetical protein